MMTRETALRSARDSYARGLIELDEFERRVEEILSPGWHPLSTVNAILGDVWAAAPIPPHQTP